MSQIIKELHRRGFIHNQIFTNHPKSGFILESYQWATKFAELSESMWDELLSSTPLNRGEAKTIIESQLAKKPLRPLRCLD